MLPWLILYFLLNVAILPISIYFLYCWYFLDESETVLQVYIPLVSIVCVVCLLIVSHHWYKIMMLCLDIREMIKVDPFLRIGDRVVLGMEDPSISIIGSLSRSSAKLSSKKDKVIGNVTFA